MTDFAKARVTDGLKMTGLVIMPRAMGVGRIVDELVLFAAASVEGEYEGHTIFLPL